MRASRVLLAALTLAAVANGVEAAVVTDLYGDKDLTGTVTGGVGITDRDLAGTQPTPSYSWSQSFSVSGIISSASLSIGHSADGYLGAGGRLSVDGSLVGSLTDLDNCGGSGDPGIGCAYIGSLYAIDTFDLTPFASLLADGVAVFTIDLNTVNDSWAIDFSEITVTTRDSAVPEPGSLALLGLGLAGLGLSRRRRAN